MWGGSVTLYRLVCHCRGACGVWSCRCLGVRVRWVGPYRHQWGWGGTAVAAAFVFVVIVAHFCGPLGGVGVALLVPSRRFRRMGYPRLRRHGVG